MNALDDEIKKLIADVVKECPTCRKFTKTKDLPKIGLRKASDINEVVSLDLKEVRNMNKYILFMVCEFSKYIRGEVINNKEPETVIKAIEKNWVHKGPGYPTKGFFSDKGKEFDNKVMKEYARKLGLSLRTTPAYSPWANGSNERNHYTADRVIEKVMLEDPKLSLQEATDLACFWQNQEVRRRFGCSPQQLMTGRNSSVPGISDGNIVTDQTCSGSKTTHDIFARHSTVREAFRQTDNSERLKKMLKTRIPDYVNRFYKSGEQVLVKNRNENTWNGPYTVKHHGGKEVIIIIDNNERSVSTDKVIPMTDADTDEEENPDQSIPLNAEDGNSSVVEAEDSIEPINIEDETINPETIANPIYEENQSEDTIYPILKETNVEADPSGRDIRPKRGRRVEYSTIFDEETKEGYVSHVGKASGNNKSRCVIRNKDGEESLDFENEVLRWKYLPKEVHVVGVSEALGGSINKTKMHSMEERGIIHMFHMTKSPLNAEDDEYVKNVNDIIHIMAVEVPKSQHDLPEVQEAKDKELNNWFKFGAIQEVEDQGQRRITGRWVITRKQEHDGMKSRYKARWCMRGFQEDERPRSDSPTVSKESLKLLLSIAANENWSLTNLDVTNAFLQGEMIDRELYSEPPLEVKKPGLLWKIIKPAYGLYDAGRSWFLAVEKALCELGCKKVTGDDALFMFHDKSGLQGLACLHVDDFNLAGSNVFYEKVTKPLQKKFTFGKVEHHQFRFTGLDIKEDNGMITVDQGQYCESLQEMHINDNKDKDRELSKDEYMQFRGLVGKLNWLQECTRPDLSFDSLMMSMKTKKATVGDVAKLNKIVKKARREKSSITFRKINSNKDELFITGYGDASYRTVDDKTRSIEGRVLFLTDGTRASPLLWKSRRISQVCHSTKEAETRAIDKTTDDAIFLARMLKEIFTGVKSAEQIPVYICTDSHPLKDSLYSTRQVERKTVRHVVQSLKDNLARKEVEMFKWVDTKEMIADLLTKDSADSGLFMEVLHTGLLSSSKENSQGKIDN